MRFGDLDKPAPPSISIPTCYWWCDPETVEWIIIPGCWARAIDPAQCTCAITPSEIEKERERREVAEAGVALLRERLAVEREESARWRQLVRHLRRVMAEHDIPVELRNAPD